MLFEWHTGMDDIYVIQGCVYGLEVKCVDASLCRIIRAIMCPQVYELEYSCQ